MAIDRKPHPPAGSYHPAMKSAMSLEARVISFLARAAIGLCTRLIGPGPVRIRVELPHVNRLLQPLRSS